jgi:hypothetical protein
MSEELTKKTSDIAAGDPKELVAQLKKMLKTEDNEMLREHILRVSKEWGIKVRLPRVA